MNVKNGIKQIALSAVLLTLLSSLPQVSARWYLKGYNFDFYSPVLNPSDKLEQGSMLRFEATIMNTGSGEGSVIITLGIQYPNGTTIRADNQTIYDIPIGGAKPASLVWSSAQSPPGRYFALANITSPDTSPDETHVFDTDQKEFEVYLPPTGYDDFRNYWLGPIINIITVALLALSVFLAYRQSKLERRITELEEQRRPKANINSRAADSQQQGKKPKFT